MVKKRNIINDSIAAVVDGVLLTASEESQDLDYLQTVLEEILTSDQISGYILRTSTKAFVNLKRPNNLLEYSVLSSQAFETSTQLSDLLRLGVIEKIVIEGKTAKVLCIELGGKTLSVFMEKTMDVSSIFSKILPHTEPTPTFA
jgi:predicted regulator of Ras-like GTPase activity (Roadblock/LC7/MglB family)